MPLFWFFIVSAFSIGLPLIAILFNLKQMGKRYQPLLVYLVVGAANELTSYIMIRQYQSNLVNSNIYAIVEYGVLLWLFFRIKPQKLSWRILYAIIGLAGWLLDNFYFHSLNDINHYFRVLSSLIICWLAINHLNYVLLSDEITPFRNSDLLLCIGLFAYSTYSAFLHSFYLVSPGMPNVFYVHLWLILSIINLITNLILFIAILWIPKHQPAILD